MTRHWTLYLLLILLCGCSVATPSPESFTPTITPSGPETTPNAPLPYPSSLSAEMAAQGSAVVVDAPPSITSLAEVQAIVAKHTQLARTSGLIFDHMAIKYVPTEERWFLVPVQADGTTISGWLEIADPTSQSGWRFGEQPTWDSRYSPSKDKYQYGLPALHDPANHFDVGFENGFPVLIEVTSDGTARYWNNIVQKQVLLIEALPTKTPIPATPKPTEAYSPTPTVPDISEYTAQPKSLDQFPQSQAKDINGVKAEIAGIKDALRKQPSRLSANATPVEIGVLVTDKSSGGKHFTVFCNQNGNVNCVPVAYLQYKDSIGRWIRDPHIIIFEMLTKSGREFVTGYVYDTTEIGSSDHFDYFSTHSNEPYIMIFVVDNGSYASKYPYETSITQQAGYQDDAVTITSSGSFPPETEDDIFPLGGY